MKKQGKLTTERETEESASSKICPVRCTSREDDSSGEIESWLFVERVSKQLLLWRHPVYLPQKFFTAYFNDTVQHNSHTILRGTREKKLLIKKQSQVCLTLERTNWVQERVTSVLLKRAPVSEYHHLKFVTENLMRKMSVFVHLAAIAG